MDQYLKNILNFKQQLDPKSLKTFNFSKLPKTKPDKVVIAGMGGSGLAGDLFNAYADDLQITSEIATVKDYVLPENASENTLFIFISCSGNTEETIAAFQASGSRPKAVIASGGKLKDLALQNNIPLVVFPSANLVPRQSTGYLFSSLTLILSAVKSAPKAIAAQPPLNPSVLETVSRRLAKRIGNRIPLIYTSAKNAPLAWNWKTRFNETAKIPSFCHALPEMDHNEIVGFSSRNPKIKKLNQQFIALLLKDPGDHPRVKLRFKLTKDMLDKFGVETLNLSLPATVSAKIWQNILLADLTAYELAKQHSEDPSATPAIQELKNRLQSNK